MRRPAFVAVILMLCAGCASVGVTGRGDDRRLARGEELVRAGRPAEARVVYEQMTREDSTDAAHATALYRLGRLYADPSGGLLDQAAALDAFDRLLAAYPASTWEPEARAWRTTLLELQSREVEAARLRREVSRLEADARTRAAQTAKLREEAARLRDETARLKADLERLKRIDLNFERRR